MNLTRMTLTVLCCFAAGACSDADRTQRTLDEDVDRVSFATNGRLEIVIGDQPGLVLESEDGDALDRLRVAVEGDRLIIEEPEWTFSWWSWMSASDVQARVVLRSLEAVAFAGAGELDVKGVDGEALAVQIAGRAICEIQAVAVDEMSVQIAGAAECRVAGRAARQQLEIAGAGMYRGFGLVTASSSVEVAGAADVEVNAAETLDVDLSGSGNVHYLGDPALHENVAGWGWVERTGSPNREIHQTGMMR